MKGRCSKGFIVLLGRGPPWRRIDPKDNMMNLASQTLLLFVGPCVMTGRAP